MTEVEQDVALPQEDPYRDPPGRPKDYRWCITAGILNALWRDTFPRLVAASWERGEDLADFINKDNDPGNQRARLARRIRGIKHPRSDEANPARGRMAPDKHENLTFRRRQGAVLDYLQKRSPTPPMPIRFPGTGGYDFLLSDEGMDLFYPNWNWRGDKEGKLEELLDFFTYRQSGHPPVGVPFYCKGGISGISASSPVGAGQVGLNANWKAKTFGKDRVDFKRFVAKQLLGDAEQVFPYRLQEVKSLLFVLRTWQVEGSVYRAIMMELPRQVAKVWRDHRRDYLVPLEEFNRDSASLKEVFRRKLETSLPENMEFRAFTPNPKDRRRVWRGHDVVITDKGFYFPKVNPIETHVGVEGRVTPAKLITAILGEINKGWAGNPVFTDSSRTEGGGDWGEGEN